MTAGVMETEALAATLERIVSGAVGLTTQALGEATPGFELTFSQWRAMQVLGESRAGERVGSVARRVGVTLPATGRQLRRLERRGLVELETDEVDRRATRARLTPAGRDVHDAILGYRRRILLQRAGVLVDRPTAALARELEAVARVLEPFA
jgi:DNA-binding MarR family transcriptional regulator